MKTLRILCLAAALVAPGIASAQEPGATPEDRSTTFRAVSGPEQESVPGGGLLVGAYGLVFGLTLLYVIRLARFARGNDERIARLEALLAEKGDR
ncbi:MAG: hypothetical protein H5U40_09480 [Polyangiaceae bacterium]|nr:hypothetical protein [Polyangiaceae bacterium]